MANFAEIDHNNIVVRVVRTPDNKPNEGHDWLVESLGGVWIKTSYNTIDGKHLNGGVPLRKNYAGVGFTYDPDRDAFIPPKRFDSWVLNSDTCNWEPPTSAPIDDKLYNWNEESLSWIEVEIPVD